MECQREGWKGKGICVEEGKEGRKDGEYTGIIDVCKALIPH